jgi:PAS domain S-box-containing protein
MDLSRFEALFEQAPLSMQLLALDGRTLRVNKAWKALWAPDSEELTDWVLSEYNVLTDPQLERTGVAPHLRRAFAGEPVELPTIAYDPAETGKPGPKRWVRAFAHPIKDGDGRVQEVMLIHEDISERVAADAAVRAAEERLRIATLAGNIGIWDYDIENDLVIWSPEVYELHGLVPKAEPMRLASFVALVHPDDRESIDRRLREALEERVGFSIEYRAVLPDGTARWLTSWGSAVKDARSTPTRMVGAVISIDAYKAAEAAMRETDRRKDEFLAMLAHELRNPLAPIRTAAEILRLASGDPQRVRSAAGIIDRQVRHLTKLMDDLLDVSRVTRGLATLEREPVELTGVIHTAVEQASPLLHEKRHSLATSLDAGGTRVMGDRARLVQIVANLLNNAARYTPEGGRIEVSLKGHPGHVRLDVSDNGAGIDPDFTPRIFELFTQGERGPDRSQGGLGIGLALVKRLVELHGGTVSASSPGRGQGATFTVNLPSAGLGDQERAAMDVASHAPLRRMRIMVIDDNHDAADSLRDLMEAMGHSVAVRYEADAALASAGLDAYDAFVIDIGLPGRDGRSLARELRERGIAARLVALTGYGQPADHALSLESGFDHHLVKPVEWPALAAALHRG